MAARVALLAVALLLPGCITTHTVDSGADGARRALAEAFEGRRVRLRLATGAAFDADIRAVEADSLRYRVREGERSRAGAVALRDVCSISPRPGGRRTGDVGVGLMGAGFVGVVIAGTRRDRVEVVGVGIASGLLTLAGVLLSSRTGPDEPPRRFVFQTPACDGPLERE